MQTLRALTVVVLNSVLVVKSLGHQLVLALRQIYQHLVQQVTLAHYQLDQTAAVALFEMLALVVLQAEFV